jgi:hypothetical protein
MKLVVQEAEPLLFEAGDVLEAEIVPSSGTGRAVLIIDRKKNSAQWITPSLAIKEGLAVTEASERELGMLRAAGYRLPVDQAAKK